MRKLPADTRPVALPGLRQAKGCAQPPDAEARLHNVLTWGVRSMRLGELHRDSKGDGVRIAVIDSGVAEHPLLAGRLRDGGDYVAGRSGLTDCEGHGTAVAGIAAAAVDAGSGFAGLAPKAEVISIRQTSAAYRTTGSDGQEHPAGSVATLAQAIVRAVGLGAQVINISETACVAVDQAAVAGGAVQAAVHYAVEHDVVVVVAAGNRDAGGAGSCPADSGNDTIVLPAWYDEDVLAVASVAPDGTASQFGIRAPWVDVSAPGEQEMSLSPHGSGLTDVLDSVSDQRQPMQGSSFAAPAVAGLAALIRARYPELSARKVMDRITATASRVGEGRNDSVGWGTIDTVAALTRTPAVLDPPDRQHTTTLAGAGVLPLPPPDPAREAGPGARWGGVLGLLAAAVAAGLAVLRSRERPPAPRP
jgi:membrane-anchored mycosin MYCP